MHNLKRGLPKIVLHLKLIYWTKEVLSVPSELTDCFRSTKVLKCIQMNFHSGFLSGFSTLAKNGSYTHPICLGPLKNQLDTYQQLYVPEYIWKSVPISFRFLEIIDFILQYMIFIYGLEEKIKLSSIFNFSCTRLYEEYRFFENNS